VRRKAFKVDVAMDNSPLAVVFALIPAIEFSSGSAVGEFANRIFFGVSLTRADAKIFMG